MLPWSKSPIFIVIYPIGPYRLQSLGGLHSHSGMTISMIRHQALPIFTGLPFMQIIRGELADEASVGFFCFLMGTWVPGLWHECGVYMVFCPPQTFDFVIFRSILTWCPHTFLQNCYWRMIAVEVVSTLCFAFKAVTFYLRGDFTRLRCQHAGVWLYAPRGDLTRPPSSRT